MKYVKGIGLVIFAVLCWTLADYIQGERIKLRSYFLIGATVYSFELAFGYFRGAK